MDAKVLNTYLHALTSVLGPLGMNIERQDVKMHASPYLEPSALIVSQVAGSIEGEIIIAFEQDTFQCLLQSFQIPPEMADEAMTNSILNELGEMVKGHAITGFQGQGIPVHFNRVGLMSEIYPDMGARPAKQSLCVTVVANGIYPLDVHFILDKLYHT